MIHGKVEFHGRKLVTGLIQHLTAIMDFVSITCQWQGDYIALFRSVKDWLTKTITTLLSDAVRSNNLPTKGGRIIASSVFSSPVGDTIDRCGTGGVQEGRKRFFER